MERRSSIAKLSDTDFDRHIDDEMDDTRARQERLKSAKRERARGTVKQIEGDDPSFRKKWIAYHDAMHDLDLLPLVCVLPCFQP